MLNTLTIIMDKSLSSWSYYKSSIITLFFNKFIAIN